MFIFQIANLENEIDMLKKSEGGNMVFKSLNLPEGMSPSSVNIINSQNEYLIHLFQVNNIKQNSIYMYFYMSNLSDFFPYTETEQKFWENMHV